MADVGYQKPTNAIVVDSGNMHVQFMKVELITDMKPGRLVKKGTNDDDAVVHSRSLGDSATAIGWLGYEQTAKKYRPATVDGNYLGADSDPSVNVQAAVLSGPGMVIVASCPAGQTIIKGDALFPATTAGQVKKLSGEMIDSGPCAIAEESKTSGGSSADIMVRSLI